MTQMEITGKIAVLMESVIKLILMEVKVITFGMKMKAMREMKNMTN